MLPWHDYTITGYSVEGSRKRLVFDLKWPYESETVAKVAKVIFDGVECYFLEHDFGENCVFDFAEVPLRKFLDEWSAKFERECKWGWPTFWHTKAFPPTPVNEAVEQAYQWLVTRNIKCIELSSSLGLSGWILAAQVSHKIIEA